MRIRYLFCSLVITFTFLMSSFSSTLSAQESKESIIKQRSLPYFLRETSEWAYNTLNKLTLEEKIAQLLMVATSPNKGTSHQKEIDSLINHYKIGGLIYFQGEWQNTKSSIEHVQQISETPLLIGLDAEWGSAMRLWKTERFPYHLTMGAANSEEHTETIAQAIAHELIELGVHINFSPVLDVNSNPKNPVIGFRSFGESPLRVGVLGKSMIKGLETNNILSCMKHFPGHGDTDLDSHYELPTINKSLNELDIFDWTPFKIGRLAGASAIMMGHLNVPSLDDSGTPSSLSKIIIDKYVKDKLKFTGLIISDALNMKAVSDKYGEVEVVVKAFEAGNDILLYPSKIKESIEAIKQKIEGDEQAMTNLNERCLKVLEAKFHTILKEKKTTALAPYQLDYAKAQIYERALTVLKNEDAIPVKSVNRKIAVVSIGEKYNHFKKRLEDYAEADYFHAYSANEVSKYLLDTLATYEVVLINLHASSMLPSNNYNYPHGWQDMLSKLPLSPSTTLTFFGNPFVIDHFNYFERIDAVVLGYENIDWVQDRAVQLIFGAYQTTGKLPVTLCEELPLGFGIQTPEPSRLKYTFPEEVGVAREKLQEIDSIATDGIINGAYPGCQIVVAKDGKVFYQKSFGYFTYDSTSRVTNKTVYDIASITKIAGSTLSLMRLQDEGRFNINDRLKDYLPDLTKDTPYQYIKLKDMMTHQAGLTPWIPFYSKTVTAGILNPLLYSNLPNDSMQIKVTENIYMLNSYVDTMYNKILSTRVLSGNKYKYSDVGYYFIKKIIEKKHSSGIDDFVTSKFYEPMGLKSLRYNPLKHYDIENIAPTEIDNYFRNQIIRGYVHDMGAAMTGGIGGHAGLFTNATDLAALMQMLLNNGIYGGERYLSESVIKSYTSCHFCPKNRRGIGFDKPVPNLNGGPTSNLVSLNSYGHSGFTGTQVWADPDYGINYVFLSNRTYPNSENWKLVKMNIRTEIQRVIYEALLPQ